MSGALLHTAFHARTAEHNSGNAWVRRGSFTVPAHYGDPQQEALAARFSCVLADVSALEELEIEGPGAASLVATAFGSAARALAIGRSRGVFWCSDGGGLRGIGCLARVGENGFVFRSTDCDLGWFGPQAPRFDATLRDAAAERGLLLLAGPFATAVLGAAGIEEAASLEPDERRNHDWDGVSIVLSREPKLNAYTIACPAEAGVVVFDRVMRAGRVAGLRLAGQQAIDLLSLETGIVAVHRDFAPARTNFAREPLPSSLGVGPQGAEGKRILAGLEFDGIQPFPSAPVLLGGKEVGQTLRSDYSLALKRAIALAQIEAKFAAPGTVLQLRARGQQGYDYVTARVVALPFL